MDRLTLQAAQAIVSGVLDAERLAPERPVAVAVCDLGGHPVALAREDGAAPLLAHIAQAKAFTCVVYDKTPGQLETLGAEHATWFHGVSRVAQSAMGAPLAGSRGGLFLKTAEGLILGAVGVAGESGPQDIALCEAGARAAGLIAAE